MDKQESQPSQPQEEKQKIRPKSLLIEKFINLLIVLRMYLTQIPFYYWAGILLTLFAVKLKREGNLPSSILLIVAIVCNMLGEILKSQWLYLTGALVAGISHFISYTTYLLPGPRSLVGMREQTLENDTYLMELFPVQRNQNLQKRVISWNHRLQMKRVCQYQESKGRIYMTLMKFFLSSWGKIKLLLAEGDEEPCDQAFVFSHGRGSTPLSYSQILTKSVSLGDQKYGVFAVQHNQKNSTGEVELDKIKRYREIQIQARAAQMASSVAFCKKKKIILMGHSHGGATTVQTYHCLPEEDKKRVSHIVLLDPWLFPLTDSKLKQQIYCPVLILGNEHFLQIEDVYNRNREFVKSQKKGRVIYLNWAKGDHLHQTDIGFLLGNTFRRIKNSQLSLKMLDNNLKAIQMFIQEKGMTEEKMREVFKEDVLHWEWKPEKWNNYLSL